MQPRYELIVDPTELWTVWDNELNQPATIGFTVVAGLSKSEARDACFVLNEVEKRRRSGQSRRSAKS